ncbi:MAG: vitamin K epoxide reductase family protein [Solirubrobacteraceae bacterium]
MGRKVSGLRIAMMAIAFIGLGVASYLTYVHYANVSILCISGDPCKTVQTSTYSKLAGVPVALIGLIGYVLILASLALGEREETRLATLALTTVGFGFSVYLTGRELFSIHAICPWCVSSAVMMTILEICAVWRFLRTDYVDEPEGPPAGGPPAGASGAAAKLEARTS